MNIEQLSSFKIWDTEEKKFIPSKGLSVIFSIYAQASFIDSRGVTHLFGTRYIFLPSTGLHDKYGEEIFLGDILSISDSEKVCVIWDKLSAGFDSNPRIGYAEWGWYETMVDHRNRIEIIGNKYKNPELIEQ